ncbi:MAG: hypothetical protein NZ772_11195 [Cyanobacteria bacterium]|nr:hypothetical protein [Cyanobacteriota bacterium]MDW8201894.1 hypothetical protein [Cyanobacteriota bacterium SKYGB_h_bin112]
MSVLNLLEALAAWQELQQSQMKLRHLTAHLALPTQAAADFADCAGNQQTPMI